MTCGWIGQGLEKLGQLVNHSRREHHIIEQRVAIGEDFGRVVSESSLQGRFQDGGIELLKLDVGFAVMIDEAAQGGIGAIMPVRRGQLHVAKRRGPEGIAVRRISGDCHAADVVASISSRSDLRHSHIMKLVVGECGPIMT